ncbi:contact-dependent growth inhibition system immunity protein [Streptomyces abyssomicinicus]|uniref:contact-dependent growth inhibition system immunity protein n=1 Tax=Streptomyces abyssomicinicus TaxID=574929 RepID=UPI00124FAD52|nr:contact-dependent growth inhibition system immunity protein [Streptomyces abyssomicinicus]
MPLDPFDHDRRYGELDQVIRAYLGQPADDTTDEPSHALTAYLRHTWHNRPWAIAAAERQLREYADNPPGRLRMRLGEFYAVPDVGLPETDLQQWLYHLADHLKRSLKEGKVPPPSNPTTHWEWHARFPELGQFLGGWYSQDMPDEFGSHDEATDDYQRTTDSQLVARLVGEITELLALNLDDTDMALGLAELGMEVDPPAPYTPAAWLASTADRLSSPAVEYGPPAKQ